MCVVVFVSGCGGGGSAGGLLAIMRTLVCSIRLNPAGALSIMSRTCDGGVRACIYAVCEGAAMWSYDFV